MGFDCLPQQTILYVPDRATAMLPAFSGLGTMKGKAAAKVMMEAKTI
jgi:hypothetical protein